ncbi:DUF2799 domain-containing protein [Vibrio sp. F13]|uniref:DUF2799 domain-containing protein n=1 Tax=unclassified Vibrio TaxID=2614977 RepID=UPI000C861E9C|nr:MULTISPECIES: DUF2799 domain-containing protein [unclassified Vibrio]PML66775.1 hypothetical protein BCT71_19770 [Vibrio sp. 10N.261.51.A7]TKF66399.1 DUF2799 domain-containing protein [Vibrio sp. F13]TKG25914.1 DUF2799 domain-containing protein [Vibrio sp. F13]
MKKIIALFAVAFSLAGCSANVQDLAAEGNWQEIGYRDGIKGHTQRSYSEMTELGAVDQASYTEGYHLGVTEYCNPNHAYQIGLSGQVYEGICSGTEDAQRFRMEWQRGWDEFSNDY